MGFNLLNFIPGTSEWNNSQNPTKVGIDDYVKYGPSWAHQSDIALGGQLDTSQPDSERKRLMDLMSQIYGQAQNGNQPSIDALRSGEAGAERSATALAGSGAAQNGLGYQTALQNMLNAKANASQTEAGQENIIRAQGQQQAQDQLQGMLQGQGATDLQQAEASQQAAAGVPMFHNTMASAADSGLRNVVSGAGQAATSVAGGLLKSSKGGEVPGKPKVFGDDERNDTVDAKLSPGEIVIPRSITESPNAAELAAHFVNAVQSRHKQHLADGGSVGSAMGNQGNIFGSTSTYGYGPMSGGSLDMGTSAYGNIPAPYLNTADGPLPLVTGLTQDKAFSDALAGQLQARAGMAPNGASVVPQQLQNTQDANIKSAMRAGAGGGLPGAASAIGAGTAANEGAAGAAGEERLKEVGAGQGALGQLLQTMRQRELGAATADQQARWQRTLLNAGVSLQNQALMRNLLGGAAQGISSAATSGLFSGSGSSGGEKLGGPDASAPGDYGSPTEGVGGGNNFEVPGESGQAYAAHGGEIAPDKTEEFIRALERRRPSA